MKKNFLKTLAAVLVLSTLFCSAAFAGWEKQGSNWIYFLDDGTAASNTWVTDEDGSVYYVGANGVMEKDTWISSGDKWYYLGDSGAMLRGTIIALNNETTLYLLGDDGAMLTDTWYQDPESGDWYYFGGDGVAYKNGWYNIDGYEYYFLKSSKMAHDALVPGGGSVGPDGRRTK